MEADVATVDRLGQSFAARSNGSVDLLRYSAHQEFAQNPHFLAIAIAPDLGQGGIFPNPSRPVEEQVLIDASADLADDIKTLDSHAISIRGNPGRDYRSEKHTYEIQSLLT